MLPNEESRVIISNIVIVFRSISLDTGRVRTVRPKMAHVDFHFTSSLAAIAAIRRRRGQRRYFISICSLDN